MHGCTRRGIVDASARRLVRLLVSPLSRDESRGGPRPSCPNSSTPHDSSAPLVVTAAQCRCPQAAVATRGIAVATRGIAVLLVAVTSALGTSSTASLIRVGALSAVPSPEPSPKTYTSPALVTATECLAPPVTCVTSLPSNDATDLGVGYASAASETSGDARPEDLLLRPAVDPPPPKPSCPASHRPHAYSATCRSCRCLAACSSAARLLSAAAAIAGPRPCPRRRPIALVSSRMRVELRVGPRTNDADATCVTSGRRPRLEPPRLSAGGCGGGEGRRVGAGARGGCAARVDDAVRADLPESSTAPAPTRARLLNASSLTAERGTAGSAARRVPARSLPRSSSDSDEPRSMSPVEPYRIRRGYAPRPSEPARLAMPNFTRLSVRPPDAGRCSETDWKNKPSIWAPSPFDPARFEP